MTVFRVEVAELIFPAVETVVPAIEEAFTEPAMLVNEDAAEVNEETEVPEKPLETLAETCVRLVVRESGTIAPVTFEGLSDSTDCSRVEARPDIPDDTGEFGRLSETGRFPIVEVSTSTEPSPPLRESSAEEAADCRPLVEGKERDGVGSLGRFNGISRNGDELSQMLKESSIFGVEKDNALTIEPIASVEPPIIEVDSEPKESSRVPFTLSSPPRLLETSEATDSREAS